MTWTRSSAALVEKGFPATAFHCCRLLQQRALRLPSLALTPSEIAKPETCWVVDPDDRDENRPIVVMLTRRMIRAGISRFVPDPQGALAAAEQRRRELGVAEPSGDAA